MSRDRLEDLGRLAVMIDKVLQHPFFELERVFGKEYAQWFDEQPYEKRQEILGSMIKALDEIESELGKMLEIAKGIDPLNG